MAPGAGSPACTFATQKATIFFDKNLVFNGKAFEECKPSNKSAPACLDVRRQVRQRQGRRRQGRRPGHRRRAGEPDRDRLQRRGTRPRGHRWFYLNVVGSTPLVVDSVIAATLTHGQR